LSQIVFPKAPISGICSPSQYIPSLCGKSPNAEIDEFLSGVPIEDKKLTVYVVDVPDLQKSYGLIPEDFLTWISKKKVPIVWDDKY